MQRHSLTTLAVWYVEVSLSLARGSYSRLHVRVLGVLRCLPSCAGVSRVFVPGANAVPAQRCHKRLRTARLSTSLPDLPYISTVVISTPISQHCIGQRWQTSGVPAITPDRVGHAQMQAL